MCSLLAFVFLAGPLLISSALADDDYNSLNFTQIAGRNGYQTEEHRIITEDGYILTIFRMSSGKCTELKETPVLFMHGFLQSADCLLDAGPGVAFPYLLADDCFDLWVGNNRGNLYGRAHVALNPNTDKRFWAFSVDEMGIYDMPAHIDYILNITGSEKINYFGFSQGAGQIMITCSEKTEYNDKINVIVAMSPAARVRYTASPLLTVFTRVVYSARDYFNNASIYELFQNGGSVQTLVSSLCEKNTSYGSCDEVQLLDPGHLATVTPETTARFNTHFPAGVSVQLVSWYYQSSRSEYFQKYDYESEAINMAKYNSAIPSKYDVTKVTAPVVITYGENDSFTSTIDIKWLKDQLPNVLESKKIGDSFWTHFDNLYNVNLTTLVYPTVKKYISRTIYIMCPSVSVGGPEIITFSEDTDLPSPIHENGDCIITHPGVPG